MIPVILQREQGGGGGAEGEGGVGITGDEYFGALSFPVTPFFGGTGKQSFSDRAWVGPRLPCRQMHGTG